MAAEYPKLPTSVKISDEMNKIFPALQANRFEDFEKKVENDSKNMIPAVWTWICEMSAQIKTKDLKIQEVKYDHAILQEGYDNVEKRLDHAYQKNEELQEKKMQLKEQIRSLQGQSPSASSAVSGEIPQAGKTSKLPDPEVFKTGDPDEWEIFKITMHDKLQFNSDHYPSMGAKVAYLRSRLGGEAQQIALPYSQTLGATTASVFKALDKCFSDPQAKKTARTSYNELVQGTRSFPEFLGLFQKYAIRAGIPESQQIEDIRDKVSLTLQQASFDFEFDTLDEVIDHLHAFVSRVKVYTASKNKVDRAAVRRDNASRSNPPARGSQQPTALPKLPNAPPPLVGQALSARRPIICLNCSQPGHIARNCPREQLPGFTDRWTAMQDRKNSVNSNPSKQVAAVELPAEDVDEQSEN